MISRWGITHTAPPPPQLQPCMYIYPLSSSSRYPALWVAALGLFQLVFVPRYYCYICLNRIVIQVYIRDMPPLGMKRLEDEIALWIGNFTHSIKLLRNLYRFPQHVSFTVKLVLNFKSNFTHKF